MSSQPGSKDFGGARFGVGQSAPRKEDPALLRGEGRYTDDLMAEGQVHLAVVRSPVAHGILRGVDISAARDMAGVLGAWTGADLKAAGYGWAQSWFKFENRDGTPYRQPERCAAATDRVRFVGEAVAFVVAETAAQAKDTAEVVELDIEELPPVLDMTQANAPDAPQLFDNVPDNVALDYHVGDSDAVEAAFANAAHVGTVDLVESRVIINPMELRAYLAEYDAASDHFTLKTQSQGVFQMRNNLADFMGIDRERLTVLTGHVGGSFGMRMMPFPEQLFVLHAARELQRPVRFLEERTSSFLTDTHGRAASFRAELAIDEAGRMLAMRIDGHADMGAYLTEAAIGMPTMNVLINGCSMYRLPLMEVSTKCVMTNLPPIGAYRGAGRQLGNYITERVLDATARVSGIDRIELRRINQLRPEELPYTAQSGLTYDCGDFTALMDQALEAADADGFEARRAEAVKAGKLRGLGVGCYLEASSAGTVEMGGIRFEENGDVTFITGTLDYGQGHASTYAQILCDQLGLPFDRIRLLQGNSDELLFGGGSGGSRSTIASGTAAVQASAKVRETALQLAGWALDTNANDIEFRDGRVVVVSTGEGIDLIDLARRVREADSVPDGLPKTLDVSLVTEGAAITFPNGCHICEIEIEEATGTTRVVRYTAVNDMGVVVNPMLLEGQVHGGVTQGIGQCLLENVVYDDDGQLLSGSFTDYCMPRADDVPIYAVHHHNVPTGSNPLGVKGVGESGCAGSHTSVMSAVLDALSPLGITAIDMPATPEKLWRAIRDARQDAT